MTGARLLPRLSPGGVDKCLAALREQSEGYLQSGTSLELRLKAYEAHVWYAASGGTVDRPLLGKIMGRVDDIARKCGFPMKATERQKAAFDKGVAAYFAINPDLGGGELLRDDVWAFVSCVLLQEFVIWRYSLDQKERFAGGVRNTFQRLWMRGRTLDLGASHEDRWRLLKTLSEDAMVQIFERASIAGDARLSRALAAAWVTTAEQVGRGRMEGIMRQATKLLRLRNQVIDLAFLPDAQLEAEVCSVFRLVAGE